MYDKKFACLEINIKEKIFTVEPETFNMSNKVIYDGTLTATEDGYIIIGDQLVAGVHDVEWSPIDPDKVHSQFVKETDTTKREWKLRWFFQVLPLPYYIKTKVVKKEVKKGWVLLNERQPVTIRITEKFSQIIEIQKKKEGKKKTKKKVEEK